MEWVKNQKYYEFDYPFDDVHSGHLHMLVINIPKRFENTVEQFHKGNYSKMYEHEDLYKFFENRPTELGVLTRDKDQITSFLKKVNKLYNTEVEESEWEGEVDFPIKDVEEFFNVKLYINNVQKVKV